MIGGSFYFFSEGDREGDRDGDGDGDVEWYGNGDGVRGRRIYTGCEGY
jgi:hypothetical protein